MEDVHPLTLCFSHLAAGTLLSPLLLVRTRFTLKLIPRLIAQSLVPNRKKYFGPFHALYVISREEKPTPSASILSTFYSFQALFPTIILSTITPLLKWFCLRIIEDSIGLDPSLNPITYKIAQMGMLGVQAFITCPLELIRNRLYLQRLGKCVEAPTMNPVLKTVDEKDLLLILPFEPCVETNDREYKGVVDCLTSVIQNEGSRILKKKSSKISVDEWQSIYGGAGHPEPSHSLLHSAAGLGLGVSSLFRGFWPRYMAMLVEYVSEQVIADEI